MRLAHEISVARSYRDVARMLFLHLSRRSQLRAVAVQDKLGLWHTYPGRRPRLDTEGFASLDSPERVALKTTKLASSLRAATVKLRTLLPVLRVKLEAIDSHERLARSDFLRAAEERLHQSAERRIHRSLRREIDAKIGIFSRHSHDLKTPLSMIVFPLETLVLHEEKIPPKLRLKLEKLKMAVYGALRGVTNTLDAARVLGGGRRGELVAHNLSDFVRHVAEVYAIVFESYGSSLATEITPDIWAEIDAVQMEKVLNNLFSNAIKHNIPGSRTVISVGKARGGVEISVVDGGLGINYAGGSVAREQEKVRGGWAFSSHGFGLKIVRELVRANRGSFSLKSKTGIGTVATVRLPLIKRSSESCAQAQRPFRFDHTFYEVELLAAERTALSRRPRG